MDLLVGSTGFVGGNLIKQHEFSASVHSVDVMKVYDMKPSLCVYAGVPSEMFIANGNPDRDFDIIKKARDNIRRIKAKKNVLISTIAVYSDFDGSDENSSIVKEKLPTYGRNRYQLEEWVKEDFSNAIIVRLPAIYGDGIKKNFVYDLCHVYPGLLSKEKYSTLSLKYEIVKHSYIPRGDGFYSVRNDVDKKELKQLFESLPFNAISFTDSRSVYQFYYLGELWKHIVSVMENNIEVMNLVTEPVSAKEIFTAVTGDNEWKNEMSDHPLVYRVRTLYDSLFNGNNGWIYNSEESLNKIFNFVNENKIK